MAKALFSNSAETDCFHRVEKALFDGYGRSSLSCSGESRCIVTFKSLAQEAGEARPLNRGERMYEVQKIIHQDQAWKTEPFLMVDRRGTCFGVVPHPLIEWKKLCAEIAEDGGR